MEYLEAIAKVEAKLLEYAKAVGYQAHIYDYTYSPTGKAHDIQQSIKERPYCGIRVSEVSFSKANGGCSFMQVDVPHGLAVCAATERVLLALVEEWEEEEIEDEFWRLQELLKPKDTENV